MSPRLKKENEAIMAFKVHLTNMWLKNYGIIFLRPNTCLTLRKLNQNLTNHSKGSTIRSWRKKRLAVLGGMKQCVRLQHLMMSGGNMLL
jgi:hypothetical protein